MLSFFAFIQISALIIGVTSKNEVCDDRFTVVSTLTQEKCPDNFYLFQDGVNECFPQCLEVKEGLVGNVSLCGDHARCPPGMVCKAYPDEPDELKCQIVAASCFKYYINHDINPSWKEYWKPTCSIDGKWAAKQCKGEVSNGRCFCYDEAGKRLPGQQWTSLAQNMTCACSRQRADLEKDPNNWYVSLHCNDEGNYEPLQCSDKMCWCAEPQTGEALSMIVPESMMTDLPCYNKYKNGEQYMRQCESHLYAQRNLIKEFRTHGTTDYSFTNFFCDGDGTYTKYKIEADRAICVWKDNTSLGGYAVDLSEAENNVLLSVDCNCARDKKIFEASLHPNPLKCRANGNYNPNQRVENGFFFCIDGDGFRKCADYYTKKPDCNKCKGTVAKPTTPKPFSHI